MYHNVAVQLTSFFLRNAEEKGGHKESVLVYGAELLLSSMIEIVIVLVIGCCYHRFWETVLFLSLMIPLRSVAGGFHAPGYMSCTISFSVYYAVLAWWLEEIPIYIHIILLIVTGVLLFCLAPVADYNKPLNEMRRKTIGKKARIYFLLEVTVHGLLLLLSNNKMLNAYAAASMGTIGVLLLLGYTKNKIGGKGL